MVHQMWERSKRDSKFVLIEDLQTNKLKTISARTLYRRLKAGDELKGYDWFLCSKCKGKKTTKYGSDACPRCHGVGTIWIDAGNIDTNALYIDRTKRTDKKSLWELISDLTSDA